MRARILTLVGLLLLAGCSSIPSLLYKIEIQQGNVITQVMVSKRRILTPIASNKPMLRVLARISMGSLLETIEMKMILSTVKEHNSPVIYENVLKGIHVNFGILKEIAVNTKTKFDDGIIDLVLEAVSESAETSAIDIS